jgi:hypothetical protein
MKFTREQIEAILPTVMYVYTGIPNRCMCGCSGEYVFTTLHQEAARKEGMYITAEEINDEKVIDILQKYLNSPAKEKKFASKICEKIFDATSHVVYYA